MEQQNSSNQVACKTFTNGSHKVTFKQGEVKLVIREDIADRERPHMKHLA